MATLLLENVPDDLYHRIEQLASVEQVPVADEAVRLLQEAVQHQTTSTSSTDRSQREILDDVMKGRFAAQPGLPTVADMLREDRQR
ncbi:MAG: hypothetical protein K2R98_25450 [Gemmataceae bacterium]|nr:hypothetical protein [Gemmataceae bacterium]